MSIKLEIKGDRIMPNFMNEPDEEYEGQYKVTKTESDQTGGTVDVTYYKNGKSTVHWGGPCGDSHYDENGEEC